MAHTIEIKRRSNAHNWVYSWLGHGITKSSIVQLHSVDWEEGETRPGCSVKEDRDLSYFLNRARHKYALEYIVPDTGRAVRRGRNVFIYFCDRHIQALLNEQGATKVIKQP